MQAAAVRASDFGHRVRKPPEAVFVSMNAGGKFSTGARAFQHQHAHDRLLTVTLRASYTLENRMRLFAPRLISIKTNDGWITPARPRSVHVF
jgi:hypothetical protein